MSPKWADGLDAQQRHAVAHPVGPIIVLAGAGSGKTRVLTHRIAFLLDQGVSPAHILALTFTNKAADTMRERLRSLVGPIAESVSMGTFHSLFARWLRRELTGQPVAHNFVIYDEEDSRAVLRNLLRETGGDPREAPRIRSLISRWKNEGLSWEDLNPRLPLERWAAQLFPKYQARLRAANALDFDDLLLETERLFLREPAVLQRYQTQIQHILVDEYQDTNPLQYRILRLLASKHRSLFVVGDDAQSIYRFRGADIRNFRYMERDFAPVTLLRLERNYRSTPQILNSANALLHHSRELYSKKLYTHNPDGPKPFVYEASLTSREEALFTVQKIREELLRYHLNYGDFAILYRINAYARVFEEELLAARIPYRLVGGLSFYQLEEVKHFLAFLRFIVNPADDQAILRISQVLGEKIGETTLHRLQEVASEVQEPIWTSWEKALFTLREPQRKAVQQFFQRLARLRQEVIDLPLGELVEKVLEYSQLRLYYAQDTRAAERQANLEELVSAAQEYVRSAGEAATLQNFLERIALLGPAEDVKSRPQNAVWLSTVHGVKGMEFHTVFIVGAVEGLFPLTHAWEEGEAALEEERRIFYVALTRARRHLYVTYPQYLLRSGVQQPTTPSPFLAEAQLIGAPRGPKRFLSPSKPIPPLSPAPSPALIEASPPEAIQPGCLVEHSHYGKGTVVGREENGAAGVVQIHFERVGLKKLDLRYARLRLLSEA
ncbi:MAG: UvrD-helicase domain-containing protein [Bacteroidia bacterium]|nr:UvrD-helicase domain-containing protein [Bacteroidia bacterium]MDW8089597.1 UvrD-helicase domain-containing protein [Bacteroidia bacterium]